MKENSDGGNNPPQKPPSAPNVEKQRPQKRNKPASGSAKPIDQKKKSFLRSWRSTSPVRKIEIIFLACGVVAGFAYVVVTIWGILQTKRNFSAEYRPRVIFIRPPELLGRFGCEVTDSAIHLYTGPMRVWVKNTGKAPATGAFVVGPQFQLVPEKKIGIPYFDNVPSINDQTCRQKLSPKAKMFPIDSGQEVSLNIAQSAATVSLIKTKSVSVTLGAPPVEPKPPPGEPPTPRAPIAKDAVFQLYAPICVYYFDTNGTEYGDCMTYRLALARHTQINDSYGFSCSESPITGALEQVFFNFCEN